AAPGPSRAPAERVSRWRLPVVPGPGREGVSGGAASRRDDPPGVDREPASSAALRALRQARSRPSPRQPAQASATPYHEALRMTGSDQSSPLVKLIDRLARTGRVGRELAVRFDVARSIGLAHAWRRFRYEAHSLRHSSSPSTLEPAYRSIWLEAARAVGAEVVELPAGFLELRANGAWTRVWRHWVMLDDAVTLRYTLQKALVQERLSASGLPVPEHLEFEAANLAPAAAFLQRGPTPCVVKPVGDSGGSGVTSSGRTQEQLMRAGMGAWRIDDRLLIERQIPGENYRFLFLDGVLLDVVRRRPPRVTGDGRSTVEQLVEAENERRWKRSDQVLFWRLQIDL